MEINLAGAVIGIILVAVIASILFMGVLILLNTLKIIKFHEKSGIILYGIIGGIVLTFIVFKTNLSCNKTTAPQISTAPEKKATLK